VSVEAITLDAIRTDGGTQARGAIDAAWVDELAAVVADGAGALDPVVVFYDGAAYWLADGFHRVAAYAKAGRAIIRAEVNQGTRRDAVLYACGANAKHGLRRTNADKRRAVETLLRDEKWSLWSDNEIAKRCGVSHPFVGKVRAETSTCNGYKSDDATAVRTGADGRAINTANIGKRAPAADPPAPPPAPAQRVEAPAAPVRPVVAPSPAPAPVERPQPAPSAPVLAPAALPIAKEARAGEAPPVDARGDVVPERLRPAWDGLAAHAAAIEAAALPLRRAIEAMLDDTAEYTRAAGKSVARGPWHDLRAFVGKPLDAVRYAARELAPRYLCADCGGNDLACKHCDGAGWTPAARVAALEASAQKTAEARVKAAVAS